jgi:hypothetical protein
MLFYFLSYCSSETVFIKAVEQYPNLLRRTCWQSSISSSNPRIAAQARAHHLQVLPYDLRSDAAEQLEYALLQNLDASFLDEPQMVAVIPPLNLIGLGLKLRTSILPSLEERIDEIVSDADLDEESESHFKKLLNVLDRIEEMGVDSEAEALIEESRNHVRRSVEMLEERKREDDDNDESEEEVDWTHIVTQNKAEAPPTTPALSKRSLFNDVDR